MPCRIGVCLYNRCMDKTVEVNAKEGGSVGVSGNFAGNDSNETTTTYNENTAEILQEVAELIGSIENNPAMTALLSLVDRMVLRLEEMRAELHKLYDKQRKAEREYEEALRIANQNHDRALLRESQLRLELKNCPTSWKVKAAIFSLGVYASIPHIITFIQAIKNIFQ